MILKSFSKINLSLNVKRKLKKRKLHDIQSYFCLINLYDKIEINKIKGNRDKIKFKGKFSKFINKKDNSILDVLTIFRARKKITDYFSINVDKKIPVYSGMGGGTSNAACLIKYLHKGPISEDMMIELEKKIGSDLRLFFYNQGFLKNLKKIIKPYKKFNLNFLMVYPNKKCSSHQTYSKITRFSIKRNRGFKGIINSDDLINLLKRNKNDLQSIIEKKYPIIKKLLIEIGVKKGCYFSRMTGSGSVCYGVFESQKTAKQALKIIKLRYPSFWCAIAKTI